MKNLQCARCLKDSDIHKGNKLELPVMCGGNRYPFGVMLPILCKSCRKSFEEWWQDLTTPKESGNWFNKGGKDRQKNRAKTFQGIADAMAEQWGER
jgi:hypothetical protein